MNLTIGDIYMNSDYGSGFSEKISVLKKNKSFSFSSSLYIESHVGTRKAEYA